MWYEDVHDAQFDFLPHVIDADKLRPSKRRSATDSSKPSAWQMRAKKVEEYLAQELSCRPTEVKNCADQLMKLPDYSLLQRQNPLGIAFSAMVAHVLREFGNPNISYEVEVKAEAVFPGISMPGRSASPSIDILALSGNRPAAVISSKWSLRHDRINDITNECPIYEAAAMRSRNPLKFYVVTNEIDPSRLNRILSDDCIDGLAHVHKKAPTEVCGLDGRLEGLMDLCDLVSETNAWS